jgi:ribosome assembly protein YihI (activator of Der GTPase)
MCVVSFVHDYGKEHFPQVNTWTLNEATDYVKVIRLLEALDKKFDQRECNDAEKQKFMDSVLERIKELQDEVRALKYVSRSKKRTKTPAPRKKVRARAR